MTYRHYWIGSSHPMMNPLFQSNTPDGVQLTRVPPKQLFAHVYPLYNLVARDFELEDSLEILPSVDVLFALKDLNNISCMIEDQRDTYGYHHMIITNPLSTSQLRFLYTELVKNIEKMICQYTDGEALLRLIESLQQFVEQKQIEYVEWQVPVSDLILQQILYFYGWHVEGYIPAWKKIGIDQFEDVAVYARTSLSPRSSIKVLPEGQIFLQLVIPTNPEIPIPPDRVMV